MTKDSRIFLLIFLLQISFASLSADETKQTKRSEKLPVCKACKNVVKSFQKGIDKTARGKYEGGDAAWEEKKLGSYANSEIRFVEILEDLCKDVDRGQDQCHMLVENNEEHLETWWHHDQRSQVDLFNFLCIDNLKVCCPDNTSGADCIPCPGGVEKPCNSNGKCKGAGTRKGPGTCQCDAGYDGNTCEQCSVGYYQSYRDEEKFICSECHMSCQGHCWEGGPKGCEICNDGWNHSPEFGCQDIDECLLKDSPCTKDEFCVNDDGSYRCIACHKSCDGCHGDGPDLCTTCKEGHVLQDGLCTDEESIQRSWKIRITRYITYLGLCIATFIIFKKNAFFASIVGTAIAFYIAASEYTVSENDVDFLPKFN